MIFAYKTILHPFPMHNIVTLVSDHAGPSHYASKLTCRRQRGLIDRESKRSLYNFSELSTPRLSSGGTA